jgi:NADH:ubiquinone oxidoreductase subunit K
MQAAIAAACVGGSVETEMRSSVRIAIGVFGAVAGLFATLLLIQFFGIGSRTDPIKAGIMALFVYAPAGAIAGIVLALKLATFQDEAAGSLARDSLKSLGVVLFLCAAAGLGYYAYAVSTATPWLNPNAANPLLLFELRFPAGTAMPASTQRVVINLQTDLNTMPAEPSRFRRDDDRPVIAGEVELAYRTAQRQLAIEIEGQKARLYRIGLPAKAPHTAEFSAWEVQPDGSEIRYRAKWPGKP